MLAIIRRKVTRAEGVQAFNRANPSTDPAFVVLVGQLEQLLERARALIQRRGESENRARASTPIRKKLRRQLRVGLLRLFSRAGLAAARSAPELETVFRPIRPRISALDFAASARSMISTAREHVESLTEHGVTPALVDEAEALLDRYAATTEESAEAVSDRIKAVAELRKVAAGLMDVIARMDGLNQHRFADDPEVLAAWTSAKDVAGPVSRRNGKPADVPAGGSTPPSTAGGDVEATG